jgi:hypothetical protein
VKDLKKISIDRSSDKIFRIIASNSLYFCD